MITSLDGCGAAAFVDGMIYLATNKNNTSIMTKIRDKNNNTKLLYQAVMVTKKKLAFSNKLILEKAFHTP